MSLLGVRELSPRIGEVGQLTVVIRMPIQPLRILLGILLLGATAWSFCFGFTKRCSSTAIVYGLTWAIVD